MNKKLIVIKVVTLILVSAILIFSFIVSQNEHHIEICNEKHCAICSIIHIAQNIINISTIYIICIVVGFLIYFFLSRLHERNIIFILISLVFQKVQLNE